jgi:hypothetical protein
VDVAPITDYSGEPSLRTALWPQVCSEIERSSVLRVSLFGPVEAILQITIRSLNQSIAITSSNDSSQAVDYRLTICGTFSVLNAKFGDYYMRNVPVSASISIPADLSFHDRKHIAIPKLTRDFAKQIVDAIAHSW